MWGNRRTAGAGEPGCRCASGDLDASNYRDATQVELSDRRGLPNRMQSAHVSWTTAYASTTERIKLPSEVRQLAGRPSQ
jgi:hypothetical protein